MQEETTHRLNHVNMPPPPCQHTTVNACWHQTLRKEKADTCSLNVGEPAVLSQLFSITQSVPVVASTLVWASDSTGTGSTKHTGLLLFTSSIPLKSDSLGGSTILDVSVFLFPPSSFSLFIWDPGAVLLPCGFCVDGVSSDGITEVAISPSCPGTKGMVIVSEGWSESEEMAEVGRPARSHLGFVTLPSKASNCLRSWLDKKRIC